MADEKREPDIRDDPRQQESSSQGYPETDPTATPGAPTSEGIGSGPDPGSDAPPTNNPSGGHRESPPSKATGNPHAAGP